MAWFSGASTNEKLISNLRDSGIIKSELVFNSMKRVDRKFYCPDDQPYADCPCPIGYRATISAPHMHAHALDMVAKSVENHALHNLQNLKMRGDHGLRILDVGCGSGYLTACFGRMVELVGAMALQGGGGKGSDAGATGGSGSSSSSSTSSGGLAGGIASSIGSSIAAAAPAGPRAAVEAAWYCSKSDPQKFNPPLVIGMDYLQPLVDLAKKNMNHESNPDKNLLHENGRCVKLLQGDGWQGCIEHAPYDVIHVGAAASSMPEALLEQLAPGGTMVIPVGPQGLGQTFYLVTKDKEGKLTQTKVLSVNYVPLVKAS